MGIVRVTVSDLYEDAMASQVGDDILTAVNRGFVTTYHIRVPEMDDCDGEAIFFHGQPVYFPFATLDFVVDEIWIVPEIKVDKRWRKSK